MARNEFNAFLAALEDEVSGSAGKTHRSAGIRRSVIKTSKRSTGENLADLTVLSAAVDLYRLDTPAGHRIGKWFADQVQRFVSDDALTIHLRALHYRVSISGKVVLKPEGVGEL